MKLITRDTDYALRALCFMFKGKEKVVSVTEMVKELKIPRPFLRKILQQLDRNKVLKSYKGIGGGFSVTKPAHKIFLVDLIEVFQGKFKLNECFFKKITCPNVKGCLLRKKIDNIEKYVIKQLRSITVASLLR